MQLFSDKELAMKNFCRSHSLPLPQNYAIRGKNPILSCLFDQIKQDAELSEKYYDQATLLRDIIEGLKGNKISWPNDFTLMSSEEWIRKMRINSIFYLFHAASTSDLQKYENLLLNLAAECLEGDINLIPILEKDQKFTFKPKVKLLSKSLSISMSKDMFNQPKFYLFSCQTLWAENFFLSVYKKNDFGEY